MSNAPLPATSTPPSASSPRRGVLLLIVLSMLTLFLMLGTAYLVVSTRSRETARAFAKLAMQSESTRIPPAHVLDAAFLRIVRGGANLGLPSVPPPGVAALPTPFESLLEDKYGSSVTGTATGVSAVANAPLLRVQGLTIPGYSPGSGNAGPAGLEAVTDFPGRVITLLPTGRRPTSHRIVRADTSAGLTLYVDLRADGREFRVPSGAVPVVINGPEFQPHRTTTAATTTNEAWDAFDGSNNFLTHVTPDDKANGSAPESISSSVVKRVGLVGGTNSGTLLSGGLLSTGSNGFSYGADNDGDGVADGMFVDIGLPSSYKSNGDVVRFDVSALVVDLDSRYNVNAHGSLVPYIYPATSSSPHAGWAAGTAQRLTWLGTSSTTTNVSVPSFLGLPVGSGYGPAEVNGRWMFPSSTYSIGPRSQSGGDPATECLFVISGASPGSLAGQRMANTGSRFSAGTATPRLPSLEGRYGEGASGAVASASTLSTLLSATTTQLTGGGLGLALPGTPSADDTLSQFTDRGINTTTTSDLRNGGVPPTWWDGGRTYNWITSGTLMMSGSAVQVTTRGGYNPPPDLHGRMITTTSTTSSNDVVPRLAYAKPEWGGTETQDDPYELRLDPRAPRNTQPVGIGTANDGIFSAAELEAVLRPYDGDTFQLPQRLNALLGGVAEEARLRVTTDSWDTTAITGTAAGNIRTWLRTAANGGVTPIFGSSSVTGLIGGEVARGERFNLNRPFTADKPAAYSAAHPYYVQRQAYFKDLYTLLIAASGTASPPNAATRQKYAQWAANVVEFRDDDSTMTPFEYDDNPANGWSVDGDVTTSGGEADRGVVWGAERPEVIIAATSGWENHSTGEMFILLHRPWNALAFSRSGGSSEAIPAEPIDVELDVMAGNTGKDLLNLSRKSGGKPFDPTDTSTYPVWRLRLVSSGSTSYVRFDISTTGTTNELVASGLTSQYRMAADAWQCVMGANAAGMLVPGSSNPTFSAFAPPGDRPASGNDQPPSRQIDVYLERLTDPRATINATTWSSGPSNDDPAANGFVPMYRVVDKARMTVVNREIKPPATAPTHDYSVARRSAATLWPVTLTSGSTGNLSLRSADFDRGNGGSATWFPWNNRPFVSSAELYLVPGSDPNGTGNAKDALGLLQQYTQPSAAAPLPVLATLSGTFFPNHFFDAVHVPTRFSGIHTTISATGMPALSANAGIYSDTLSVNQLSSFREPGRVNLNTVTTDDVWNAVVAGPLQTSGTAQPVKTRTAANFGTTFAAGMQDVLALAGSSGTSTSGTVPFPVKDTFSLLTPLQSLNPAHNIYTATRLANSATVRSNVFGIWITVRESVAGDPDSIRLHRAFYIFDRSLPVAFDPGKDHNVWDAVLLRRIIQ